MPSPDQRSNPSLDDGSLNGAPYLDIQSSDSPTSDSRDVQESIGDDWQEIAEEKIGIELRNGRSVRAVQIAEENLTLVLRHFGESAIEVAGAHRMLAETYEALGTYDIAIESFAAAKALLSDDRGPEQAFHAELCARISGCYVKLSDFRNAEKWLDTSRSAFESMHTDDPRYLRRHSEALLSVGKAYDEIGRCDCSAEIFLEAVKIAELAAGKGSDPHQDALIALGGAYLTQGKAPEATRVFEDVLTNAIQTESTPGRFHFFGHAGLAQAAFAASPPLPERGVQFSRYALQTFDPDDVTQLATGAYLEFIVARSLAVSENRREFYSAQAHFERSLRLARRSPGNPVTFVAMIAEPFADYLGERRSFERENEVRVEIVQLAEAVYGQASPEALEARRARHALLLRMNDRPGSAAEAEKIAEIVHRISGGISSEYVYALREWSVALLYQGDRAMAESLLWTAKRIVRKLPDANLLRLEILDDMACQAEYHSEQQTAVQLRRTALRLSTRSFGAGHNITAEAARSLARTLAESDQNEEALVLARKALHHFRRTDLNAEIATSYATAGYVHASSLDFERSDSCYRRAFRLYRLAGQERSSDYVLAAQDFAMMRAERAFFYQNSQYMHEAFNTLKKVIGLTRRAHLYDREATLDLLSTGVELAEALALNEEAALFQSRVQSLKKKLR